MNFNLKSYYQIFKMGNESAQKMQIKILNKFRAKERSFNKIQIKENIATKTVHDVQKGKNELFFYKHTPLRLQKFYPKILSSKIGKSSVAYDMELISALDVSVFFVQKVLDKVGFVLVLKNIDSYFSSLPKLKVSTRTWKLRTKKLIVLKLNIRWATYQRHPVYAKMDLAFQKKYKTSLNKFKIEVEEKINACISRSEQTVLLLSHGDLCFSNILLMHDKKIKLVDPRGGQSRKDLFITPYYDFAKLSQCVHGNYDGILRGCHVHFQEQSHIFDAWILKKNIDMRFVRLIESSLFLSLLPLHMDRVDLHMKFIDSAVSAFRAAE